MGYERPYRRWWNDLIGAIEDKVDANLRAEVEQALAADGRAGRDGVGGVVNSDRTGSAGRGRTEVDQLATDELGRVCRDRCGCPFGKTRQTECQT